MLQQVRGFFAILLFLLICMMKLHGQVSTSTPKPLPEGKKIPAYLANPAVWINDCYSHLNGLYLYYTQREFDSAALFDAFREHMVSITMLKKRFYGNSQSLNIRSVYNMKMRMADILADITQRQNRIHRDNELLVEKAEEIIQIKHEIGLFREKSDSLFRVTFDDAVNNLLVRQHNGETLILNALKRSTAIENKIVDIHTEVYVFLSEISRQLKTQEKALFSRELPPVWFSPPEVYPFSILNVLSASFQQTLESVKYYGEMSMWRILIFRGMIVLLCLIPIKIFSDEQRKKKILTDASFTFIAKFPKTASVVMGMALSPLIFVHPPHAFMEFILIGLTFTVTMLTLKNYPKINKTLLILLITAFMILYLINFFVTPTFAGRLIYSASILLLFPIYLIYKQLPSYALKHEKMVKGLLLFLGVHLVSGWILVLLGYYTLGRSIILSGYSLLIISMILRIAIFTLLDYIEIMAYFFNKQVKTVKIDTKFVHRKTKPLLILSAIIFIMVAYLYNMNVFDLVKSQVENFLLTPRKIGDANFTLMSILLFFISVYLSFVVATLIRYTFEPQHDHAVKKRSNLGSYLLLLRLLVLCTGFAVGILVSGLALTNFAIFIGAMGVGIGFGLQNIVSNLISGLIIAFERPFVVGDVLDFGNETGKIKEIGLRATMVSNSEGADILIPNNNLLSDNLKNWTISNKQRFIELKVLTTQQANPVQVIEIIGNILCDEANIIKARSLVLLSDINETGLVFSVKLLITDLSNGSKIRSKLLTDIYAEFARNDIRFPQKLALPGD
ncbi:MAG: mechanosensitive ion channel [Bacteroidetes bacterium]|nr:mechanosensitive ion channel [Bacteroidota bacterium]